MALPKSRKSSSRARSKPKREGLGGGSVDKHLEQSGKRRSNVFAQIGDGNEIQCRVIDTEKFFIDGYVHPVSFDRKDGSTYKIDIRCLDPEDEGEPCPGCRDDLDRRYKFWMLVIVRDAPKENKSGKIIGEEDQIRILSGANRLVKALNQKQKRRDLAKRDIIIAQDGTGTDVSYDVEWASDEDTPLSRGDKALIDDMDDILERFEFYTALRDEDEFYEPPSSNRDDDDDDDRGSQSRRRGSGFAERKKASSSRRRRKQEDDDDDDDDDEDEAPRRRSSSKRSGGGIGAARKKAGGSSKPSGGIKRRSRR